MKKIQRQESSVSMPPSSTPAAPPAPPIAPQMPTARLRAAPSAKVVVRIDSEAGAITAPPRPWTARAAISTPWLSANPPASEASANSTRPDDEHAPAAEQVGGAAAEQQEAGERDRVGVDDPLQVDLGEVQARAGSTAAPR